MSHFSDVEDATVGKIAFGYRPVDQLLFRGSWSEAFRAPNLVTLNESRVARNNTLDDFGFMFADPAEVALEGRYGMQRTAQGSSSLQPEESENWNLGVVVQPTDSITLTFDYWQIEKKDTIGLFGESNHLALELLNLIQAGTGNCGATIGNPAVVRAAPEPGTEQLFLDAGICPLGEVQRIDDEYANLDTRTVEGFDIGVYFDFETEVGNFAFNINGTFLETYDQDAGGNSQVLVDASAAGVLPATVPVRGFSDLVRQNGNAKNKFTARMRWSLGNWGATLSGVRYDDFVQTSLTLSDGTEYVVDDMATFNASVDYRLVCLVILILESKWCKQPNR